MGDGERQAVQGGLTDDEKRANVLRLAFGGDQERFDQFCQLIRQEIPDATAVVLRGSAVTGRPVNIQASREIVIQFRGDLFDQPCLTLIERAGGASGAGGDDDK